MVRSCRINRLLLLTLPHQQKFSTGRFYQTAGKKLSNFNFGVVILQPRKVAAASQPV